MYKPYVLTAPEWETTSGGVRVMYGLYGHLLAKGQEVYLKQYPKGKDFIAIYPEIEHGNPTNAKQVVRYILNKPGAVDGLYSDGSVKPGPKEFDPNDKLIYFSRLFGDAPKEDYLFLPILNTQLFKDQKKNRNKMAWFLGKGIKDPNISNKFIHPKDSVYIDRELAQDQGALADLLNECEVLYCYDPVTAMLELARLCGCRIILIPSIYTKNEFYKYEPGMYGISWGKDEGVKLNVGSFTDHYMGMKRHFDHMLDSFIERTQQ